MKAAKSPGPARNPAPNLEKMTVATLLSTWPKLVALFLKKGFHCPACPMASFETLDDVAQEYGADRRSLLKEVQDAAAPGRRGQTRRSRR